jgi:hypothetical protein
MSLPDIVNFSTRIISLRHLGHCVSDVARAGLRRQFSLNHEGHFIEDSPEALAMLTHKSLFVPDKPHALTVH